MSAEDSFEKWDRLLEKPEADAERSAYAEWRANLDEAHAIARYYAWAATQQ